MPPIPPMGEEPEELIRPLPPPPVIRADRIRYQDQVFTSMVNDTDPVDAAVVECLWRIRGTGAAVADTGARFLDTDKLDERASTLIANEARFALRRLVQRGDINITRIDVTIGQDWAEVSVTYINNRSPFDRERRIARRLTDGVV